MSGSNRGLAAGHFFARGRGLALPGGGNMQGNKQDSWVMKQTVLRARDERGLERSLHSFENALRLRDGSIVDVERSEMEQSELERRARHVAVIRYEIPLSGLGREAVSLLAKSNDAAKANDA